VCDNAWISYLTGSGDKNGEGFGKLTAGYGSRSDPAKDGGKIGPEFTFGLTMDAALDEPVLIIKTAWGGKSLHTDFRPARRGAVCVQRSAARPTSQTRQRRRGGEGEEGGETGVYYRLMVEHVKRVLADPKRVCPGLRPSTGLRDCRLRVAARLERHGGSRRLS
jgi:alpha-galactosidase